MRTTLVVLVMLIGRCADAGSRATAHVAAMPWLDGFTAAAASATPSAGVTDRMARWQACRSSCGDEGIELDAAAWASDAQTVLVSYAQGIVVLDHAGALAARLPGTPPIGSADEVLAVAVGDAQLGVPVLAVSTSIGGRRESTVWLQLYRIERRDSSLTLLFAGIMEHRLGDRVSTGALVLVPQGLIYRAPDATVADLWSFDRTAGRYLYRGVYERGPVVLPAAGGDAVAVRARAR